MLGHGARQIRLTLGERSAGVALSFSEEPLPLGTGGAIRWGLPALPEPTILLLNGDSYCDVDLHQFSRAHRQKEAEASLVLSWVEDASRYGRVLLDNEDRVSGFHEKRAGTPGWINAGIYLIQRRLLEALPARAPLSLERNLLPGWVSQGGVFGYRCAGRFLDIGTPEAYASAQDFFAAEPTTTSAECLFPRRERGTQARSASDGMLEPSRRLRSGLV